MNKYKILFVHTTGSWWDHRYYFKQMAALQRNFADITYLVREDPTIKDCQYKLIIISQHKAMLARITGGLNLFLKLFKSKQDAIQLCNIELLPVGILLGIFSKKKIFYDCREDHYHAMLHSKVWFPKWFRHVLGFGVKILEFLASKTFTGFIDSDPAIYHFHHFMPERKKMIFYNMALINQFKEIENLHPKKYDFAVLGSMSIRTGVLDVIKAVGVLTKRGYEINLKLIGNPKIDRKLWVQIQKEISLNKLENRIFITGRIPYANVPIELSECKVGIIPLLDLPKFQNNIATKQFEYMAASMPVIATDLPPQKIFIKNHFNGLHYTPGNLNELLDSMIYMIQNPDIAKEMGRNGKRFTIEKWNAENQQLKFIQFYKSRMLGKSYVESEIPPFEFGN